MQTSQPRQILQQKEIVFEERRQMSFAMFELQSAIEMLCLTLKRQTCAQERQRQCLSLRMMETGQHGKEEALLMKFQETSVIIPSQAKAARFKQLPI